MKWLIRISIGVLFAGIIGIIIIATDFWLLYLPIAHSSEYPTKVAAIFMAATALATLFLALATFKATEQSNLREQERIKVETDKEKRNRRERWLNEIIEWAIEIINWRSSTKGIFKDIVSITNAKDLQLRKYAHVIEVQEIFVGMHGRNQYVYNVSFKLGLSLQVAVEKLIKSLKSNVNLLAKWQHDIAKDLSLADDMNYANKADKAESLVTRLAVKVIEEAAKLKTRDLS